MGHLYRLNGTVTPCVLLYVGWDLQAKEAQLTDFEVNHVNCYLPKNSHLGAKNVITLAATERANREHTHTLSFLDPLLGPCGFPLGPGHNLTCL